MTKDTAAIDTGRALRVVFFSAFCSLGAPAQKTRQLFALRAQLHEFYCKRKPLSFPFRAPITESSSAGEPHVVLLAPKLSAAMYSSHPGRRRPEDTLGGSGRESGTDVRKLDSFGAGLLASSLSVGTATFLTNWIDVIKVRQQTSGGNGRHFIAIAASIVRNEGWLALNRGASAAVVRGLSYGGLRIGMYTPIKDLMSAYTIARLDGDTYDFNRQLYLLPPKEPGVGVKIVAGMTSGAIAAGLSNPTDLIKTRMQAAGPVQGSLSIIKVILKEDGILGLWKGATPSMVRAAMLTAAQCVTYDEVKLVLKRQGWQDDLATHLVVSGIAGLVTTTITAPVDMVKTNVFVNRMQVWDCVVDIYKRFGVKGFFRGWGATWARQGPMTTVVFVVNEALRPVLGLQAL